MNLHHHLTQIRHSLQSHANPALVQKYARYFTEGYDAYGLDQPTLLSLRDTCLQQWTTLGLPGFLRLGDLLIQSGKYEEASLAILFIAAHKAGFTTATFEHLATWLDDNALRNWAHTDVFSHEVLAHFLVTKIVRLKALSTWRTASSPWKRRAVPVTLIKTDFSPAQLLAFITPLMGDPAPFVQKGLGWFLRELWKKHPTPVEEFLLIHKDTSPRLILQYATEKMPPAAKARYKKQPRRASATPKPSAHHD